MLQVEGMSRQELIKRREESMNRYNARKEIKFKAAQDKTYQLDKEVVKQQMKVEGHQRKHIKNEKKKLQDQAESELQEDMDVLETKHKKLTKNKGNAQREAARNLQSEVDAIDEAARYRKKKTEDIWDDEDLTPVTKPVSQKKELSRKKA